MFVVNGLTFKRLRDFIAHGFIRRGYDDPKSQSESVLDESNQVIVEIFPARRQIIFFSTEDRLTEQQLDAASWLFAQFRSSPSENRWYVDVAQRKKLTSFSSWSRQ